MALTYNNLYLDIRQSLRAIGVDAAPLEARELLCLATGKTQEELQRDSSLYVPEQIEARVKNFMERRLAGEPIAYLLEEWEFYGMTLDISPDVLIPRPDTELLAERAIACAQATGEGARVLDLCTGSGCIGLAIAAQVPTCRSVLVDVSPGAIRIAKQNIRRNGLVSRVTCFPGDATQPPDATLWKFDVIVCNPPYIPTEDLETLDVSVRAYEPILALDGGTDGLDFYRSIVVHWTKILRPNGMLLFEVGIGQADAVADMMCAVGYEGVTIYHDLAGIARVVEGRIKYREES